MERADKKGGIMDSGILKTKKISDLTGEFCVPAYQRGYRWEEEVIRLIEDVIAFKDEKSKYCLQPIVVKNLGDDRYELIDGQQRLTTIFLIFKVLKKYLPFASIDFTIDYAVRERSAAFLRDVSEDSAEDNADFYYIKSAYILLKKWFESRKESQLTAINLYKILLEKVELIWYEVGQEADGNKLFRRLNIGKIPLTNAELVKAMFLSRSRQTALHYGQQDVITRQEEIALQWDNIEKELSDDAFWYFLTNDQMKYQTRIDLILDIIAKKDVRRKKDIYETFFYFDKLKDEKPLLSIWKEILHTFLLLQDWYLDREFYHKIGYLIAAGYSLNNIYYALAYGKKKSEFLRSLDSEIKNTLWNGNYGELTYESKTDCKRITTLLLLFNVESVRLQGESGERFPFDKYKNGKWSLEHIHAQQSQGLNDREKQKEWLRLHRDSVRRVGAVRNVPDLDDVLAKTDKYSEETYKLDNQSFEELRDRIEEILSENSLVRPIHSISNLTLLEKNENSVLNNSTFDVKRNKIIEMDKNGEFIPHCTKMVFLKYYTKSEDSQLYFWGKADRESYLKAINDTLNGYIQPIKEGE